MHPKILEWCQRSAFSFHPNHDVFDCCSIHLIRLYYRQFQRWCLWPKLLHQLTCMLMEQYSKLHQRQRQIQKLLPLNSQMVSANWMVTFKIKEETDISQNIALFDRELIITYMIRNGKTYECSISSNAK